jgi:hypothetical protein
VLKSGEIGPHITGKQWHHVVSTSALFSKFSVQNGKSAQLHAQILFLKSFINSYLLWLKVPTGHRHGWSPTILSISHSSGFLKF